MCRLYYTVTFQWYQRVLKMLRIALMQNLPHWRDLMREISLMIWVSRGWHVWWGRYIFQLIPLLDFVGPTPSPDDPTPFVLAHRPSVNFHIFDFSEIAERNSTKLDRKQDLNVLYQVCVFWENKMAALASDWLRHFRLLLWNRWMEFNETLQEARSKRLLPSLCYWRRSQKQERNSMKLDRKQDLNVLYQVCVFRVDWKKKTEGSGALLWSRVVRRPSLTFNIFDFFSETPEKNSTKLDRKQDLNVLYQVCVFRADWKNKMAALASDWLRHFRLLHWNRWTEFNETWQEARSQRPLPSLCFSGRLEK